MAEYDVDHDDAGRSLSFNTSKLGDVSIENPGQLTP